MLLKDYIAVHEHQFLKEHPLQEEFLALDPIIRPEWHSNREQKRNKRRGFVIETPDTVKRLKAEREAGNMRRRSLLSSKKVHTVPIDQCIDMTGEEAYGSDDDSVVFTGLDPIPDSILDKNATIPSSPPLPQRIQALFPQKILQNWILSVRICHGYLYGGLSRI